MLPFSLQTPFISIVWGYPLLLYIRLYTCILLSVGIPPHSCHLVHQYFALLLSIFRRPTTCITSEVRGRAGGGEGEEEHWHTYRETSTRRLINAKAHF